MTPPTTELVVPGVHRLDKVLDWGWSIGMHLLELPGGGVLVHSPTWCGEGTFDAIDALGEVRAILAPNHFHHLGIERFRARYPGAIVVAAPGARPRLGKKGHAGLAELDALAPLLPAGARVLACDHVKSGEVWLTWPTPDGPALIVCDGFFHVTRPVRGFAGWVLRRMKIAPGLCFGWTYKALVVRDRAGYRDWASRTIAEIAPAWLIPSHGAALRDDALAERLVALLSARLPA